MTIRVIIGQGPAPSLPTPAGLEAIHRAPGFVVEASADVPRVTLADGRVLLVAGHPVGWRAETGGLKPFSPGRAELAGLAASGVAAAADALEGRFALVLAGPGDRVEVAADEFGQIDLYTQQAGGHTVVATDLSLLPVSKDGAKFDQAALVHALAVFSWRPPKQHTFYQGVKRLAVGDVLTGAGGKATITQRPFTPAPAGEYGPRELDQYSDLFLEALEARGSRHGNVVYLSSGWDSTATLAGLVRIFGARGVRAVIGRMQYSKRAGVINQVEVDRATAVAAYFKVPLDIVEFDYWRSGPEDFDAIKPTLRAHNICGLGALNHWRLAKHVARTTPGQEAVFAGEISDGAHNLGFSQYLSIFHSSLEFREYSDKMAGYLYGPSFAKHFAEGRGQDDLIYQIFRNRTGSSAYDAIAPDAAGRTRQMLSSFFLRGNRLPLWSLKNTRFLTDHGRAGYSAEMEKVYLAAAAEQITPETHYAWYLRLYNSFHWQGSTVATIALTAGLEGLRMELPFWDSRLMSFLSSMPESWGRGLDLHPTKYPLKWMLKNKIDYPYHLQVGPHSYLYDVNPKFSLAAETMYASAFAPYLAKALKARTYRDVLSSEWFDVPYFDGVVDRYLAGTEAEGGELNDLTLLCWLSAVGVYGQA